MRLMSILSLVALAIYTYVLRLCRHYARPNSSPNQKQEEMRWRLAISAFSLDMLISLYFGAITPLLLKQSGLHFDRKSMPKPLFWFFTITGTFPTLTMTLTVVGGQRWQTKIRGNKMWRLFHIFTALLAYFSWWVACSPLFLISLLGEDRAIAIAKKLSIAMEESQKLRAEI
jgi:hypothetical protein